MTAKRSSPSEPISSSKTSTSISPPPSKRQRLSPPSCTIHNDISSSSSSSLFPSVPRTGTTSESPISRPKIIPSPFSLTDITDLPSIKNEECVTLSSLISSPLINELWIFDYLHSIPFVLSHIDEDIRTVIPVHFVHGFSQSSNLALSNLREEAARFPNVQLHCAPMPELYGTHHSKMIILLRRDDYAQVIIHTANMIPHDWRNMTQGVWKSPLLPRLAHSSDNNNKDRNMLSPELPFGSGERFKVDLLHYLRAYDSRRPFCTSLRDRLRQHDFSAVRGTLIASVPGRHQASNPDTTIQWGYRALLKALEQVSVRNIDNKNSEIVVQISSVATLGPTDTWLKTKFLHSLEARREFRSTGSGGNSNNIRTKIVFPTTEEVCRSLDGYDSGSSIHWKIQSPQQQKQLTYMRPMLYHWANDSGPEANSSTLNTIYRGDSGRNRAAPHIKTYTRWNSDGELDWALLTSANISKQAWGDEKNNIMRISSWEIGVLIWPALYGEQARMVPTFLKNTPDVSLGKNGETIVGFRMPYSLPLKQYGSKELPWVATLSHSEPDWRGATWQYQ